MSDEELIARLRDLGDHAAFEPHMHHVAADRIELLATTNEQLVATNKELVLQLLSTQGQAAEAKLATCERYRDAYAEMDRIGTQAVRDLEAKLAENEVRLGKAVEALKIMCEEFRGYDLPYGSKAYSQATSALAEIKSGVATTPYGLEGESHE